MLLRVPPSISSLRSTIRRIHNSCSIVSASEMKLLVENKSLTPAAEQALAKVLDQKNQVAGLENEITSRQHEVDTIAKDQARVRENMKALKGSAEEKALLQRYARQLDQQEDRLNAIQKEVSDLNGRKDKAQRELERI